MAEVVLVVVGLALVLCLYSAQKWAYKTYRETATLVAEVRALGAHLEALRVTGSKLIEANHRLSSASAPPTASTGGAETGYETVA